MSDTTDRSELFTADMKDPYVARFLDAMGHRRAIALQIIMLISKANCPVWQAQQCFASLSNAIQRIPSKAINGPTLTVIHGDKK